MAVGEYVSVSSQRDAESADLDIEAEALRDNPRGELHELARIYQDRGVEPGWPASSRSSSWRTTSSGAHTRDELGITDLATAKPVPSRVDLGRRVHRRRDLAGARGAVTHVDPGRTIAVVTLVALVGARCDRRDPSAVHRVGSAAARTLVLSSAALLISYGIGHAVGTVVWIASSAAPQSMRRSSLR